MQPTPISRDFLSYWLPPFLGVAVILSLSGDWGSSSHTLTLLRWLLSWVPGVSPAHVDAIHGLLRKSAHVLTYGVLYFLWFRAFQGYLGYGRGRGCLWSLALCLAVALTDEGHQAMVRTRTGSLLDVVLDAGGAGLAALLAALLWRPPAPGRGQGFLP